MSALCSPLLDLSDEEAVRLSPEALDRLEADALQRFRAARRYDYVQWAYLVETWNDLDPEDRKARHAVCARTGRHDWRGMPMDGVKVCQRCVTYKMEDPSGRD